MEILTSEEIRIFCKNDYKAKDLNDHIDKARPRLMVGMLWSGKKYSMPELFELWEEHKDPPVRRYIEMKIFEVLRTLKTDDSWLVSVVRRQITIPNEFLLSLVKIHLEHL